MAAKARIRWAFETRKGFDGLMLADAAIRYYRGGLLVVLAMAFRRLIIRSWVAVGATFAIAAGCRDLSLALAPPALPAGAEAMAPLPAYADWWQATEQCSGLQGDLSRLSWFFVPNRTSFVYANVQYDGYWWNGVHWILLAGEDVSDSLLVRHEMLHELLGRGDHPPEYFQQKCAGVVVCNEACRDDN